MANEYSADDLLDFLAHASGKGLMPAATATALGVATRNVLNVLDPSEREDLRKLDINGAIRRFNNKRAKDFSPTSLKEYGRRLHRAMDLFIAWKNDPTSFTVKTRSTSPIRKKDRPTRPDTATGTATNGDSSADVSDSTGYRSAIPIRPGIVVTISNIPPDLTEAEAERLGKFIKLLVVE